MFELPMTTFHFNLIPAICFYQLDNIPNFHLSSRPYLFPPSFYHRMRKIITSLTAQPDIAHIPVWTDDELVEGATGIGSAQFVVVGLATGEGVEDIAT